MLALALAVAAVPLAVLSRQGSPAEPLIAAASFTAVGLVVARRHPRNPVGWLLAAIGILILLTMTGGYYAVLVYRLGYRLPLGPLALVLDVFSEPALLLMPLVILLFPDGRLPSQRWRWTLEAYLVLAAGYMIALIWAAVWSVGAAEPVDAGGAVNAVDHPAGWLAAVQAVVIALYVPFWLAFVARQVQSWRHAGGERRQQLKWLVSGTVVCMIAVSSRSAMTSPVSSTGPWNPRTCQCGLAITTDQNRHSRYRHRRSQAHRGFDGQPTTRPRCFLSWRGPSTGPGGRRCTASVRAVSPS